MKTIYPHGIFKAIPITVFVLFLAISALATTYTVSSPIDGTALVGNAADTLYVDAKITVTSVGGSDVIWNFTTVIVRPPGGEIRWSDNEVLNLPNCTTFTIQSGASGLQPASGGSASKLLILAGVKIAVANVSSNNAAYSFADFNSAGGLATFTMAGISPICYAPSFTVTVTPVANIVSFNCIWSVDQGGSISPASVSNFTGPITATILPTNSSTSKTYTIKCTIARAADAQQDPIAVKTFTVTVDPQSGGTLPTLVLCSQGSGNITLGSLIGSVLQWESSTDASSWTTISNTTTTQAYNVSPQTTYFRALVKSGACPSAYTNIDTIGLHNYWSGTTSVDWTTAGNWSDKRIPSFGLCNTVTVPAGTTYSPRLNASTVVPNITILDGATLDLNNNILTVSGAFAGTGKLKGSATSGLVISTSGDAGTVYFDTSSQYNQLKTLTVNTGASLKLGNDGIGSQDTLNIAAGSSGAYGTVTANGSLDANGVLTLKSNVNGTARVGQSTGTISGNVTVERYIPARRAWRFLTVPFNTSTQTVRDAWQEGVNNFSLANNLNPHPGYGTHITGDNNSLLGWDFNTTQNPSYKVWDSNTNDFSMTEPATNTTKLTDYRAYCIFVRGSRAVDLSLGESAPPDPTVLRATGTLNQTSGNNVIKGFTGGAGNVVFIGNPYVSTINILNIIHRGFGVDTGKFWIWDPKLTGTKGVGGYVAYSNGAIVPSNSPSYPNVASALRLQSGQGFMVQLSNGNTSGGLDFRETDKDTTEDNVFGLKANANTGAASYPIIYTNLMLRNGDQMILIDGVGSGISTRFSSAVDKDDAGKLWNFDENIALMRNNKPLAIEMRQQVTETDTLFYDLILKKKNYALTIFAANLAPGSSPKAWLIDKYLNKKIVVNLLDTTVYKFKPTSDNKSYHNRFMLVFKNIKEDTTGIENNMANMAIVRTEGNVVIYPNPLRITNASLQFTNMDKGSYAITVYSPVGQKLASRNLQHNGGSNNYSLPLEASWKSGVYRINIIHEDSGKAINVNLVISR